MTFVRIIIGCSNTMSYSKQQKIENDVMRKFNRGIHLYVCDGSYWKQESRMANTKPAYQLQNNISFEITI